VRPAARDGPCAAASRLCGNRPEIGTLVPECTDRAPWAGDVARHTARPVCDMRHRLRRFRAVLAAQDRR